MPERLKRYYGGRRRRNVFQFLIRVKHCHPVRVTFQRPAPFVLLTSRLGIVESPNVKYAPGPARAV